MEFKKTFSEKKHIIALMLIMSLSILFRFYNLETVPQWDFDEGYNMRYSYDLLHGEMLWFAIKYTFLPHPPLFFITYALVIKYLGVGVYTIRLLTALIGVATTITLYFTGKEMFNRNTGLLASFIYATTPEVIFWNRLGFANNELIMLSALSLYFIYKYSNTLQRKHLYISSILISLCVITEYTALLYAAAIAIFLHLYHKNETLKATALSLLPLALLFAFMLYHSPEYFMFDLRYQLSRFLSPAKILFGLIGTLIAFAFRKKISKFYQPIADSINQDTLVYIAAASLVVVYTSEINFWHATTYLFTMTFFGLCMKPAFLIEEEKERRLLILLTLSALVSMLALDRADHMTMTIYPFAAVALAAMLYKTYSKSLRELPWIINRLKLKPSKKTLFALTFYALFISLLLSINMFLAGNMSNHPLAETNMIASYINEHANEEDLVLTYSWMFPLIEKAKTSLLTESLAYEGIPIAYYSGQFPKERFAFNTSYKKARYLIASNGTLDWIINQTKREDVAEYIDGWNKTSIGGQIIYENPENA